MLRWHDNMMLFYLFLTLNETILIYRYAKLNDDFYYFRRDNHCRSIFYFLIIKLRIPNTMLSLRISKKWYFSESILLGCMYNVYMYLRLIDKALIESLQGH